MVVTSNVGIVPSGKWGSERYPVDWHDKAIIYELREQLSVSDGDRVLLGLSFCGRRNFIPCSHSLLHYACLSPKKLENWLPPLLYSSEVFNSTDPTCIKSCTLFLSVVQFSIECLGFPQRKLQCVLTTYHLRNGSLSGGK